jgi:hypothetical protein
MHVRQIVLLSALLVVAIVACSDSTPPAPSDSSQPDSGQPDSSQPDSSQPDSQPSDAKAADGHLVDVKPVDQNPGVDAFVGNPCEALDGICVVSDPVCTAGGGTVKPQGKSGCDFDPPGTFVTCCAPPAPKPQGTDCESRGGLCTFTPGGCYKTHGFLAPLDAMGTCPTANPVCCLPASACPSNANLECCMGTWTAVPACDRGTLVCIDGKPPVPKGTCLGTDAGGP